MARLAQARRKVAAVFIRVRLDGVDKHVREPYNVVTLDWGDGSVQAYMEPAGYLLKSPAGDDAAAGADASARAEVYDELRIYDAPPFPQSRWGISII